MPHGEWSPEALGVPNGTNLKRKTSSHKRAISSRRGHTDRGFGDGDVVPARITCCRPAPLAHRLRPAPASRRRRACRCRRGKGQIRTMSVQCPSDSQIKAGQAAGMHAAPAAADAQMAGTVVQTCCASKWCRRRGHRWRPSQSWGCCLHRSNTAGSQRSAVDDRDKRRLFENEQWVNILES